MTKEEAAEIFWKNCGNLVERLRTGKDGKVTETERKTLLAVNEVFGLKRVNVLCCADQLIKQVAEALEPYRKKY